MYCYDYLAICTYVLTNNLAKLILIGDVGIIETVLIETEFAL
jgi:hypothetical protein